MSCVEKKLKFVLSILGISIIDDYAGFVPCKDFSFDEEDNSCEYCDAKEKICNYLNGERR